MHGPLGRTGNGRRAAWHLLRWAERQQDCPDPLAFTRAIEELFAEHCDIHSPQGIDLDLVMKSVLRLACRHEVRAALSCKGFVGSPRLMH